MSGAMAAQEPEAGLLHRAQFLKRLDHRHVMLVTLALAALVYSQFGLLKQPLTGDHANWDYMAQLIVRGGVPYRDAVNIKSPISAYIGAAAILVARPFGLWDTYAIRIVSIFLAVLTAGLLFLVVFEYFQSLRAAILAALIFISFNGFAYTNSGGIQPKTPMILFGLVSMWAIRRDRPYISGIFGMLSALSWQPGLMFAGAAFLAFSRYLTSWRDGKALRLVAGAAIPLCVLLGYFWAAGALRDFYLWGFHFNHSVYGPENLRSFIAFLRYLQRMWTQYHLTEAVFFYLAAPGILIFLFHEARLAIKNGARHLLDRAPFHAMFIVPLVYLLFCRLSTQGMADSLPFLPFVAAFTALAIVTPLNLVLSVAGRVKLLSSPVIGAAVFLAICVVVFRYYVADAFKYELSGITLREQEEAVKEVVSHLQPGDGMYIHGATEILVFSGMDNLSKHFLLDRGKDSYLDVVEEGGFYGWLERLKAERPKIVVLTRLRRVNHAKDFTSWVAERYEPRKNSVFSYYLRKE